MFLFFLSFLLFVVVLYLSLQGTNLTHATNQSPQENNHCTAYCGKTLPLTAILPSLADVFQSVTGHTPASPPPGLHLPRTSGLDTICCRVAPRSLHSTTNQLALLAG